VGLTESQWDGCGPLVAGVGAGEAAGGAAASGGLGTHARGW
jgi:hypothetical protein